MSGKRATARPSSRGARSPSQTQWDPAWLERSPVFAPLRPWAPARGGGWPSSADLQRAFDERRPPVRNARGMPLRIAGPARRRGGLETKYEARILLGGELPVRPGDWHDYFNALVWLAFPRAKAALNARHVAELERQHRSGEANRGPVQDALTLFDEGGVIVASSDPELLGLLRDWKWKALFWTRRADLGQRLRFHVFGHALYEKALRPFIGITGRGIVLEVEPEVLSLPLVEQLAVLDGRVASRLSDPARLAGTRELAVVPVLGVPGWFPVNDLERFYDNTDYFRPARSSKGRGS